MPDSVRQFYDTLAADYHLIFGDWNQAMQRHGTALNRLIRSHTWDTPPETILDCACGIGTQAIALAQQGYRVHGTDLSSAEVQRAAAEASQRGVVLKTGVADMRELAETVSGTFDVVLACDNALPHLLTEEDVLRTAQGMRARLRSGGLVLISIRDYDYLQRDKPPATMPWVFNEPEGRRIVFQVWDWSTDAPTYDLTLFILQEKAGVFQTTHVSTTYRAWQRAELNTIFSDAGFNDVRWHMPQDTGFFQPIVTARP